MFLDLICLKESSFTLFVPFNVLNLVRDVILFRLEIACSEQILMESLQVNLKVRIFERVILLTMDQLNVNFSSSYTCDSKDSMGGGLERKSNKEWRGSEDMERRGAE